MGWGKAFREILKCDDAPCMANTGHGTNAEYQFGPFRKIKSILDHGLGFLRRRGVEDGDVGILMDQNTGVLLVLRG